MTETAVANGDTRTLNLFYVHTGESLSATYLVNGQYNAAALQQLNWFLRDWRRNEPIDMDPRLFDVVWEAYRSAGAEGEVVTVVSAYRSPQTNAMLRARSRSVAKFSQHMLGKAMDTTMPGMPMSRIREVGMRMQRGGVGYYPTAGTPFVHLDVGSVRAWPRMNYDQLVRLFPDGKTVHIPSNGQPLARYEEAKADIEARNNGAIVVAPRKTSSGGFFAFLFGGGGDEEGDDVAPVPAPSTRKQWAQLAPRNSRGVKIAAAESDEEGGGEAPVETRRSAVLAKARANLPRGETVMTAAPDDKPPQPSREKPAAANAPLPPGRPASLDKPTPLEPPAADRRLAVASVEPDDAAKLLRGNFAEPARESASSAVAPTGASAPLPPRRPQDLAASVDAPLPPIRPIELAFAAGESAAPVAVDAPLPPPRPKGLSAAERGHVENALTSLIDVTGSLESRAGATSAQPRAKMRESDIEMLAYAPPAVVPEETAAPPAAKPAAAKTVLPKTGFVPARLDHSNFQAMTQAAPASKTSTGSVLGASIGAVRSAARATEPSLLTSATGGGATRFSNQIAAPATDRFAAR